MSWIKHGNIFSFDKAQLPVVSASTDGFVCFFSNREQGKSHGCFFTFEVAVDDNIRITAVEEKVLMPGDAGACDVAGCMPMQLIDGYLYYIGWTPRKDVPYFNYVSIAKFGCTPAKKLGPILSPDLIDQGFSGTFFQLLNHVGNSDKFLGYYLSADKWTLDENDELQPSYDIKICESDDRLNWKKTGKIAIARFPHEAGVSSATVISHKKLFHMWFSVREAKNFRGGEGSYSIQHATSVDGLNWVRDTDYQLKRDPLIGEDMCAYPSIFKFKNTLHMFYNGRGFGDGGVSHATMHLEELEK